MTPCNATTTAQGARQESIRAASGDGVGQGACRAVAVGGAPSGQRDVLPVYVGDDVTDEDAFRALHERGIGVLVAEIPRPTAAHYSVQNVAEVRELLRRIAACQTS